MEFGQPVIARSLRGLEDDGLVQSTTGAEDRRVQRVGLSRKGQGLVQRAQRRAWPAIEAAVGYAYADLRGDLLAQRAALEAALADRPLHLRAPAL
jgi:DNA-binding MarR family transcriptional regulator